MYRGTVRRGGRFRPDRGDASLIFSPLRAKGTVFCGAIDGRDVVLDFVQDIFTVGRRGQRAGSGLAAFSGDVDLKALIALYLA